MTFIFNQNCDTKTCAFDYKDTICHIYCQQKEVSVYLSTLRYKCKYKVDHRAQDFF